MSRFFIGLLTGVAVVSLLKTAWGPLLLVILLGAFVWFLYKRDPYFVRQEAHSFGRSLGDFFKGVVRKVRNLKD